MNRLASAAILTALFLGVAGIYASNTINGIPASDPLNVAISSGSTTTAATNTQNVKAVTTAGTPVVLTGTGATLVQSFEIHARKNTTTANTGNIYVGFSASGGSNYRVLSPGDSWGEVAPPGKKLDMHLIYIDAATSADAVTWTALN